MSKPVKGQKARARQKRDYVNNKFKATKETCESIVPHSILGSLFVWIVKIKEDVDLAHAHYTHDKIPDCIAILDHREEEISEYLDDLGEKFLYMDDLKDLLKDLRGHFRGIRELLDQSKNA